MIIKSIKTKKKSTENRQWTKEYKNLISGCAHDCRYCYAKASAVHYKQNTPANWKNEVVRNSDLLKKGFRKRNELIMFPSSHDITPDHLNECMTFLYHILKPGNNVLIVSKPHLICIKAICDLFSDYKNQILFRFTIGSADSNILKFWENNAPDFDERLESLKYAFNAGYETSVSCEPMLDDNIDQVIAKVLPYVTETIWLGIPNRLMGRLSMNGFKNDQVTMNSARALMKLFSDAYILNLYERYKNNLKIRWKSSIKKVLGKYGIEIENDNLRPQILSDCMSVAGMDSFVVAEDFKSIQCNL
jgi:DNA repair photolyase